MTKSVSREPSVSDTKTELIQILGHLLEDLTSTIDQILLKRATLLAKLSIL